MTKSNALLVLSTASNSSIIAITIMNMAIGSRMTVILHIAAIIAATINVPILLVTRFMLFLKSIGRLLIASLVISTSMHPAMKPKIVKMMMKLKGQGLNIHLKPAAYNRRQVVRLAMTKPRRLRSL